MIMVQRNLCLNESHMESMHKDLLCGEENFKIGTIEWNYNSKSLERYKNFIYFIN